MLNMAKLEFPICLKSTPALSHPVVPPFTWPSRILGIHICSAAAAAAAAAKSLQSCLTLQPHGLQSAMLLCPWDSLGKNSGVGCHVLLQGVFLTQGLKLASPAVPVLQVDSLLLSH